MTENFVRFVYAFVQMSSEPCDPMPVVDITEVNLDAVDWPQNDGSIWQIKWREMRSQEVGKMAQGMVMPVSDFLTGEGHERPLIKCFDWTPET